MHQDDIIMMSSSMTKIIFGNSFAVARKKIVQQHFF